MTLYLVGSYYGGLALEEQMQFAIMKWVAQTAMPETIYGIVDKSSPVQLPTISPNGHWEDFA